VFGIAQLIQEAFGLCRSTDITRFAPLIHSGANFIYEWERKRNAGVVEGFGGFGGADVAGGPAARFRD